ncbi:YkuS family protein [Proteinivorax hydrogeniformans]|uniref:YkuS family protein n=1 Tax=Proteinivorax hydrogeniformans TaxID=1826727 RepID=A0AAU8HTT1_9FIRM
MKKIVALEDGLSSYKEKLEEAGFKVVDLSQRYQYPSVVIVKEPDSALEQTNLINEIPVLDTKTVTEENLVETVNNKIHH